MSPDIFKAGIAKKIAKALGKQLFPVTLHSVTTGTRTPGGLTGGTNPSQTDHTCRGFVSDYKDHQVDGTIIRQGDRKVVILGDSISPVAVPKPNDKVTVESHVYVVIRVNRDPAGATYTLQAR